MNNEDNNLDLLDLDDNDTMDTLPEVPAFAAPRPKKPWLLLTVGVMISQTSLEMMSSRTPLSRDAIRH